jgi:hypothetical protein
MRAAYAKAILVGSKGRKNNGCSSGMGSIALDQLLKSRERSGPLFSRLGPDGRQFEGIPHHVPRGGQRRQMALGDGLHQNIPQRRAFAWPGNDWNLQRVRGELIQQHIFTAAANDMESLNLLSE